jgi:hypothetical protein
MEYQNANRIDINELISKIGNDTDELTIKSQSQINYERLYSEYKNKVSKDNVEKAISRAIANGRNYCKIIYDKSEDVTDQLDRYNIYYNTGIDEVLTDTLPTECRIYTKYHFVFDKNDHFLYKAFKVIIYWGAVYPREFLDYFKRYMLCCGMDCVCKTYSRES